MLQVAGSALGRCQRLGGGDGADGGNGSEDGEEGRELHFGGWFRGGLWLERFVELR